MPKLYFQYRDPVKLPTALRGKRAPLPAEMLPDGCYRLTWLEGEHNIYEGTLRVHRVDDGIPDVSGDLYAFDPNAQSSQAGDEIPVFARENYRHYLQFTFVKQSASHAAGVELEFERVTRLQTTSVTFEDRWDKDCTFQGILVPAANGRFAYAGNFASGAGQSVVTLRLDWVSPWLRAAAIEIDCEKGVPVPAGNGGGIGWATVGASVGWQFTRLRILEEIPSKPENTSWSDAECHLAMATWREKDCQLDREWRYHLLCVGRLESADLGVMYDVAATDSSAVGREGAAIAANWPFPNGPTWGNVEGGRLFGSVPEAYFRTAVHEIGHAMSLYHDIDCNCLMVPTESLAASKSLLLFPANIHWAYHEADQMFLRHAPDPLVRPGGDWPDYRLDTGDRMSAGERRDLLLSVRPLLQKLPLGAPVRVQLKLTRHANADGAIRVPADLSLSGPHVSGYVTHIESGDIRSFRPLVIRCGGGALTVLASDGRDEASLTLLRGGQGALFPTPGDYEIVVELRWTEGVSKSVVTGKTTVMVEAPKDGKTAEAVIMQADTLLTLVLGGDHIKAGMEAIDTALKDPVLRPHYAWIEAKRRATLRDAGKKERRSAARLIDIKTVLSPSEHKRAVALLELMRDDLGVIQKWRLSRCLELQGCRWPVPQWLVPSLDRTLRFVIWILRQ